MVIVLSVVLAIKRLGDRWALQAIDQAAPAMRDEIVRVAGLILPLMDEVAKTNPSTNAPSEKQSDSGKSAR